MNIALPLALVAVLAAPAHAQRGRALATDDEVVAQSRLASQGRYVDVYAHDLRVDPSFSGLMDAAYERVEAETGLKYDSQRYGPKLRVYVSNSIAVSHVWGAYRQTREPRGIVFLNQRAYAGALNGSFATHAHELVHIIAWGARSGTLREGFADFIALKIFPGRGAGPNSGADLSNLPARLPAEVVAELGTPRIPPDWVNTDPARRASYYAASHALVRHLVGLKGVATFLQLYRAEDTEGAFLKLYGMRREQAVQAALGQP